MSARSFAWPVLGLALILAAGPASAVTINVEFEDNSAESYGLRLEVVLDGGQDVAFNSCVAGNCFWDVSILFSEAGGVLAWSGRSTHEDGETWLFAGTTGTSLSGTVPHGNGMDVYSAVHDGGSPSGDFIFSGRHVGVPEPALALLVVVALAGARRPPLGSRQP